MNTTCNGYTNWDTFIVCLYSDNEERLYNLKLDMLHRLRHADRLTRNRARCFATDSGLIQFCLRSEDEFDPGAVDWEDVANSWTSELEEYKQYNA